MDIAVIVPVKDDSHLLARCLMSLHEQCRPASSVLIVDNGSRDPDTVRQLCQRYGAIFIEEPTPGIPAATATGFDHAVADVLARLDADCVAPRDWLARIETSFAPGESAAAVTGPARFIDGPRALRRPLAWLYLNTYRLLSVLALARTPLFGSNCAIRSTDWQAIARHVHRTDADVHDDLDITIHLGRHQRILFDPHLRMGISMRPFGSAREFGKRMWRGWHTLRIHAGRSPAQDCSPTPGPPQERRDRNVA